MAYLKTKGSELNKDIQISKNESVEDPLIGLDIGAVEAKFGKRFFELTTIIGKRDPLLMIALGAPEDEYDLEAATILPKLDKAQKAKPKSIKWLLMSLKDGLMT